MERTLLARHADVLVTMDDARREIPDGALFVRGNRIEQVGRTEALPESADTVLDLAGHVAAAGPRQHAPPHVPDADARRADGAGQRALRLVAGALSRLGPAHARCDPRVGADGDGRADAVGLHDLERSPLRVSERLPPRRHDRGRPRDRPPLPCHARCNEPRSEPWRASTRRADRGRGRGPARCAARDRGVPRSCAAGDAAHRPRSLFAVQRDGGADARSGVACPELRRPPAHAPRRERDRRRVQSRAVRPDSRRVCRGIGMDRRRCLARALRSPGRRGHRNSSPGRGQASRIAPARTCASGPGRRRCARCATRAFR